MELRYLFKKTQTDNNEMESVREKELPKTPQGLFHKCDKCGQAIFAEELRQVLFVCPTCGNYFRMFASTRISDIIDRGTFEEWDIDIGETNPLKTPGYEDKIKRLQEKTELDEAVVTGKGLVNGHETCIGVMDCRFMMASMGSVVGEKITRAFEYATENKLPVVLFTASGGARMQEGIISLMQMAKTSGAIARHSEAGQLYVTVMTDPTTGGVTASFASLGDIIIAEPKVLIGFAGRRVIEGTIKQKLPDDFQSAEFMLENGFVDMIVERKVMRPTLSKIFRTHNYTRTEEYRGGAVS